MAGDHDTAEVDAPAGDEAVEAAEPERRHGALVGESRGQAVLFVDRERYLEVMAALRDEGFELCSDLCAVDHLTNGARRLPAGVAPERFEVVVNLLSLARKERVRVRVQVPEADPVVPSLFRLWPGTEAMEREAWDLLGVAFDGHPDLTRILMPEDWEGHPLRKDHGVGRIPVQFKGTARTQPTTLDV